MPSSASLNNQRVRKALQGAIDGFLTTMVAGRTTHRLHPLGHGHTPRRDQRPRDRQRGHPADVQHRLRRGHPGAGVRSASTWQTRMSLRVPTGSITLSAAQGTEGERAQDVLTSYDLIAVGRAQNVRVEVHSELRPFHEIGQRYATQLRAGNVTVRGTIGRAYINGALLKLLLGEAAESRPVASWAQPSFNVTLLVQDPANDGHHEHRHDPRRQDRGLGLRHARGRIRAGERALPGALPDGCGRGIRAGIGAREPGGNHVDAHGVGAAGR